jgi:hypothetical protein
LNSRSAESCGRRSSILAISWIAATVSGFRIVSAFAIIEILKNKKNKPLIKLNIAHFNIFLQKVKKILLTKNKLTDILNTET